MNEPIGPESSGAAKDPVIVTGAPRTGVRLLAAILDGHPAFASGPDLPFLATLVQQWHRIDSELGVNHARHHGVAPEASHAAFRSAALKLFAPRLRQTGKQRFVFQSFAPAVLLDEFARLFPAARFILTIRDPRDVVRSLLRCNWRDVRSEQPLPYTRDPVAAARFSVDFMNAGLGSARALVTSGRLLTLRYEALCAEPKAILARVGTFLNDSAPQPFIAPDSAVLVTESADNPHPPLRAGSVDTTSIRRSRPAPDLGEANAPLERLRSGLGYQPAGALSRKPDTRR